MYDHRKANEIASAAHIPCDCKAPATSKTNARVADLNTRTHGTGNDRRK